MPGNVIVILSVILSFVVAQTVGSKRRIGFGWSLFFCLTTSALIGYFITCLSSKKTDPPYTDTKAWHNIKLVAGAVFIMAGMYLLSRLRIPQDGGFQIRDVIVIALPFTLMFTGIYLGWYTSTKQYNRKYEKQAQ